MSVIRKFVILEDHKKSLKTTINFLLNCQEYSWDKIYLFSAFVSNPGVEQIKKILLHPHLNKNTEVVIAIGTKYYFNDPSDIQNLLRFIDEESTEIKTKPVRFICPTNNFHIKAYCFLGRHVIDNKEIGFSIIGSSNLTKAGLECEGELCISIHDLNLTKGLNDRWSNKYKSESHLWNQLRIKEYERQYKEHSRKDQKEVLSPSQENSTPVNHDQPRRDGKFIELGVLTDSVLLAKATTLANYSDNIDFFHSSPRTLEQAKVNFPEGSLCLLFSTENEIFQIGEIVSHSSDKEETEGCFVRYRKNVTYELSNDIYEILANEKYKIIADAKDMEKLPYDTLKDFEEEVNEYQKMLGDQNYQTGLKKGEKKMQKMQSEIYRILELEIAPSLMKEQIKKILQSI